MAYKRYARKYRRRRGHRRLNMAYKLKKLSKVVNRTKPTKKIESTSTSYYISNLGLVGVSGNAVSVFNPSDGTAFQSRQNPIVHADSIEVGTHFVTSGVSTVCRGILYTSVDATVPPNNFVLNTGSSLVPYSSFEPSSLSDKRYKVLWDTGPRVIGTGGGLHPEMCMRKKINLKGMKIGFGNSTGSTVPDYHALQWVAFSDSTDAVTTDTQNQSAFMTTFRC